MGRQNIKLPKLLLQKAGLKEWDKGYEYLYRAILMTTGNMLNVSSVTKLIYPEIAKEYGLSVGQVERAIRNLVELSWEQGDASFLEELFGYSPASGQVRPTNSEYIAAFADAARIQARAMQNGGELWKNRQFVEEIPFERIKYFMDINI